MPFCVWAGTLTHRTVTVVIAMTQVILKNVSDHLCILLTKAGRGVIQFRMSSFQKVSQRGKYSFLDKSPKWICSFYNYLLSSFCTPGMVLKHNAMRWMPLSPFCR